MAAWELGRKLKPQRRADWSEVNVGVLTDLLRAKISQHQDVRKALLATGNDEIVEVNPNDNFWGSGKEGNGLNHTGNILMKLRAEIVD